MGFLDFFKNENGSNTLFSKNELESIIKTIAKISDLFASSETLSAVGRHTTMYSRANSYVGIWGYYYEEMYHYGNMSDLVNTDIAKHYSLIRTAMSNEKHRINTIKDLADNWSDVLQVLFNLEFGTRNDANRVKSLSSEIQNVTLATEKISGAKCRPPKDPRIVKPRNVTYNPYRITEDPSMANGHIIPDITSVLRDDLLPRLINTTGNQTRDVIVNYTISLIKSYSDNAGYVPMVIVDQITGQVDQVRYALKDTFPATFSPYSSLKEYVLSIIYK